MLAERQVCMRRNWTDCQVISVIRRRTINPDSRAPRRPVVAKRSSQRRNNYSYSHSHSYRVDEEKLCC